ncbi:hypothetical protein N7532_003977 [Penicillium argentinense]|uniref:Uncharacterized protein n=1 Tax=Penicillium argentinense TaxID=1131581 RepID=A0A9W9FNI1_9EURO|nr:uncharacterized protein N7532_003977 [Penicillium argentinense]KAJ5103448.1 hypothetical protein N7532_003977 [Penicillium argentinense]
MAEQILARTVRLHFRAALASPPWLCTTHDGLDGLDGFDGLGWLSSQCDPDNEPNGRNFEGLTYRSPAVMADKEIPSRGPCGLPWLGPSRILDLQGGREKSRALAGPCSRHPEGVRVSAGRSEDSGALQDTLKYGFNNCAQFMQPAQAGLIRGRTNASSRLETSRNPLWRAHPDRLSERNADDPGNEEPEPWIARRAVGA